MNDILDRWRDRLMESETIRSFCRSRCGREPEIFIGPAAKDPPGERNCPYILVFPVGKSVGEAAELHSFSLCVGWGVMDGTAGDPVGTVRDSRGTRNLEGLGNLIRNELAYASATYPSSVNEVEYECWFFWPQLVGRMEITVEVPRTCGGFTEEY
ncbi:hypothetical protein KAR29_04775 [Aminithiophilus ramosus]|uniref:Uncharacterized protein n=1 Tax=Aminithiophilus ramosus TaxID=3029084 RepID=A0A9Q7AR32_9BACT|nr:hypothetical protein [Aminithiophilus ramosus]QTX33212.1 hypothetical protein KAR29_04775 [Aminithiophilus ramosus]